MFRRYDEPGSHFAPRLAVAQRVLREALDRAAPGPVVVLDICGGSGRVVLPVLADHPRHAEVRAYLIDRDAASIAAARTAAAASAPAAVNAIEADAGLSDTYGGLPRADIVILSGVLVHLSPTDRGRLLRFIRQLASPGAQIIWTIGWKWDPTRMARVRRAIGRGGFAVLARHRVNHPRFNRVKKHEVSVARFTGEAEPFQSGRSVFAFRRSFASRHPALARWLRPLAARLRAATRTAGAAAAPRQS